MGNLKQFFTPTAFTPQPRVSMFLWRPLGSIPKRKAYDVRVLERFQAAPAPRPEKRGEGSYAGSVRLLDWWRCAHYLESPPSSANLRGRPPLSFLILPWTANTVTV